MKTLPDKPTQCDYDRIRHSYNELVYRTMFLIMVGLWLILVTVYLVHQGIFAPLVAGTLFATLYIYGDGREYRARQRRIRRFGVLTREWVKDLTTEALDRRARDYGIMFSVYRPDNGSGPVLRIEIINSISGTNNPYLRPYDIGKLLAERISRDKYLPDEDRTDAIFKMIRCSHDGHNPWSRSEWLLLLLEGMRQHHPEIARSLALAKARSEYRAELEMVKQGAQREVA